MINKFFLFTAIALFPFGNANAICSGRGTAIIFGNGMFNSVEDARQSLRALSSHVRPLIGTPSKEIKFDLAYKRNEPILEQLVNVLVQKKVTDFENYWSWLSSLQQAPDWFQEAIRTETIAVFKKTATRFNNLETQFEIYSKYVREGFNIILISHSQGNMFANQAIRKLPIYTDASLTGPIEEKEKKNPLFPKFFDYFANIQVATPVSETVNQSPWATFKDDVIMATVRSSVGALPGNLNSMGVGLPPNGDLFGHSFIKSYLRNDESREKILADIKAALARLRYPIAYFSPALTIEHLLQNEKHGISQITFSIKDSNENRISEHDEKSIPGDPTRQMEIVNCFHLKPGDSIITASTTVDSRGHSEFSFKILADNGIDQKTEKTSQISFQADQGFHRWDIGVIHTKAGKEKEPLDVSIEIFQKPILRKK